MKPKKYFLINKDLGDYGVATYQELWKKAVDDGCDALLAPVPTTFTKSDGNSDNEFDFIFSSEKEDRQGDIVRQDFDLKAFKKNPVFLDSHDYWSIESIIGRVEGAGIKDGMLQGKVVFAVKNPKGQLARDLAADGFLSATSIGFIPKVFSDKGEIMKSELLEVSAVSVPAQPEATIQRSQKDVEPEEPGDIEPEAENEPEPVAKTPVRRSYLQAIQSVEEGQKQTLKKIAKVISDINLASPDRYQQKRTALQSIRSLISTDT